MSRRVSVLLDNNVVVAKVVHESDEYDPDPLPDGWMDITKRGNDIGCLWTYNPVTKTFKEPPPPDPE